MSEQLLKDFGARVETLVEIPDFAQLDKRGHQLRVRRRAGVAGALAMVLAVAGVLSHAHRPDVDNRPIDKPILRSDARAYNGNGQDLRGGTYMLQPSLMDSHLVAEFTLPVGWNAWVGPQAGKDGRRSWYANALIMEVDRVGTHGCMPDTELLDTPDKVVASLARAWSYKLVRAPEPEQRFGYPATRLRLLVTNDASKTCPSDADATFHATQDGYIPFAPRGTLLDLWVVDVDGRPIFVQRATTRHVPQHVRRQLDSIIDSIEFKNVE